MISSLLARTTSYFAAATWILAREPRFTLNVETDASHVLAFRREHFRTPLEWMMARVCFFFVLFFGLGAASEQLFARGTTNGGAPQSTVNHAIDKIYLSSDGGTAEAQRAPTILWPVAERNGHDELLDTPVYSPDTKSYFEMVDGSHGMVARFPSAAGVVHEGPNWAEAYQLAQERTFKGVRGRLAIVKSFETHEFLSHTFRPKADVWIGLRYWCTARKLQWSDGEMMSPGSFQAWARQWKQDVYACASDGGPREYMPIAYSALPTFDWIGKGIHKRYPYFFVEYPTGKE